MAIFVVGCILTAISWITAWAHFGMLTEFSFFPLWLGYILTLNGLAEIVAGISLLNRMRWSFGWLFAISAPFWWFFEGMNEIVHNWHYQSPRPISPLQYFIQASIDFSTVVPATMSASFFILHIVKRFSLAPVLRMRVKQSRLAISSLLGTLSFSFLALFPEQTFPLVWIAPILIIEPIAYAADYPSLLRDLEGRDSSLVVSIMIGTLFTGFWWELWNYCSLPKWTYTIPYVGFWKVFEMPIVGYLGYPFFGLIIFGYTGIMLMLITGGRLDHIFRSERSAEGIVAGL
jgi:hypothetical protein